MPILTAITKSIFWTKLTHWEYWPVKVIYAPIFIYYLWLSIKARSFYFISVSNPGIPIGGLLGVSKKLILDKIPIDLVPITLFKQSGEDENDFIKKAGGAGLGYPLIAKPDIGERGFGVEKIKSEAELREYLLKYGQDILLQEFVDLPIELGIFYYRIPGEECGTISSIVQKDMLSVTGDGISTIHQLMSQSSRAKLQLDTFKKDYPEVLKIILEKGEEKILMQIGNHSRGTAFLNGNHLINDKLVDVFDSVSRKIEGFYYGRFDIKCESVEELYNGKFVILELNGAASEPAHIYHPGFSIIEAYRVLFHHWDMVFKISMVNKKNGHEYMPANEFFAALRRSRVMT